MRVQDQEVTFSVFKAMKFPKEAEDCFRVDLVGEAVADVFNGICLSDPLEAALKFNKQYETLDQTESAKRRTKTSLEEPPVLELKPLLNHLRYAYLRDSNTLPIIISASLDHSQEDKLLRVLREYKTAIGWTIADIKGISPSICMHKILLEEGAKPIIEPQQRLNLIMKEVVKKEIIKWLDTGIIYPISDSSWVSPVQCVPKKGGMTVVANENNELIPTRMGQTPSCAPHVHCQFPLGVGRTTVCQEESNCSVCSTPMTIYFANASAFRLRH
ncbi:hypothetical protein MRB53_026356 [Persea americana]|uniref:Uncharacterized protein n=1 Tax=Persea americana TaxID=3435 RepID=A0ACC2LIB9_PERAE|nr:hypothetical protein MRB53_026356 [Persea americana]